MDSLKDALLKLQLSVACGQYYLECGLYQEMDFYIKHTHAIMQYILDNARWVGDDEQEDLVEI